MIECVCAYACVYACVLASCYVSVAVWLVCAVRHGADASVNSEASIDNKKEDVLHGGKRIQK